jgi:fatty acid/phospholipid biosynthesis enzyme
MPVRIVIDAMGGDNAPKEIIRGLTPFLKDIQDVLQIFGGEHGNIKAE